jgi:KDO2-lipid IV(A) lauroyltransferase
MEHGPAGLSRLYARLLDLCVPKLRGAARRNLEIARMPAPHEPIIDGVFASIARILHAVSRFPRINSRNAGQWIRYEGFEHYQTAKRRGRGVLFATAHLGNWELSAYAHALLTEPMHIVVRPLDNSRLNAFVERRRRLSGNHVISKKDAARAILRALRNNDAVGILIDQNVMAAEGTFVDFFGVKACAGTAFVKLAHHSGAAVIPGFALWSDREQKFVLRFYQPLEMTGDAAQDTQRLHSRLEQVIREYPDQWLWIHRRWKTRPPGEPPIY